MMMWKKILIKYVHNELSTLAEEFCKKLCDDHMVIAVFTNF